MTKIFGHESDGGKYAWDEFSFIILEMSEQKERLSLMLKAAIKKYGNAAKRICENNFSCAYGYEKVNGKTIRYFEVDKEMMFTKIEHGNPYIT